MQMKFILCAGFAALAVAACEKTVSEAETPSQEAGDAVQTDGAEADGAETATADENAEDLCGAADYQSLVGSNMAAVTLPADLNHRVIGPNDVVTMDYNPERLNIYTDENGVVTEVKCG